MVLIFHVICAVTSIVLTSLTIFNPSKNKLATSCTLAVLTLSSGTYLIITSSKSIVGACISGITYFVIVGLGLLVASRRLVKSLERI